MFMIAPVAIQVVLLRVALSIVAEMAAQAIPGIWR